jgi:hypothetical protein
MAPSSAAVAARQRTGRGVGAGLGALFFLATFPIGELATVFAAVFAFAVACGPVVWLVVLPDRCERI